jgi:2-aminoadipate transaminase
VPIDSDGIRTDILRDTLARLKKDGIHPKMIYVMSNYHNPGGIMLSQERRRELAELAVEYDTLIAEDDAYSELLYDVEQDQTPIKAYDTTGNVLYLGSFSKLVAPGLRVGWAIVPDDLVKTWNICRPMFDVGSPSLNQELIAELHADNWLDGHIVQLIEKYKSRRDAMLSALEENMPSDCTWTPAHGGFYVWVTAPDSIDIDRLLDTSVKNGIIYFTGKFFYLDYKHHGHIRLCYSWPDEGVITEGVKRIASSVKEELAR